MSKDLTKILKVVGNIIRERNYTVLRNLHAQENGKLQIFTSSLGLSSLIGSLSIIKNKVAEIRSNIFLILILGYRPILDAMKTFAADAEPIDIEVGSESLP